MPEKFTQSLSKEYTYCHKYHTQQWPLLWEKKINEEDVINKTWIGQDILIAVFSLIPGISWST